MEKKNSTSKASKASKTQATVSNSKTSVKKTAKKTSAKEVLFAGKVARKSNFKTSKWSVIPNTVRKFTEDELEAIHSIRIFSATDKKTGEEYWFIKVLYMEEESGELYEISFTPDLKLIDKAEHGDHIDPKRFRWYKMTDGDQVIERAYGTILKDDDGTSNLPY